MRKHWSMEMSSRICSYNFRLIICLVPVKHWHPALPAPRWVCMCVQISLTLSVWISMFHNHLCVNRPRVHSKRIYVSGFMYFLPGSTGTPITYLDINYVFSILALYCCYTVAVKWNQLPSTSLEVKYMHKFKKCNPINFYSILIFLFKSNNSQNV